MASIHEAYGRLQERYDEECETHRRTIGVLADLKSGALRLDQLEVDPAAAKWTIFPGREKPQDDGPDVVSMIPAGSVGPAD